MRMKHVERLVKRGRRTYGAVYKLKDGREVYLAWRKQEEIFRAGERTMSDAFVLGKASWALNDETLMKMRLEGVEIVGVAVKETGDLYITHISKFLDEDLAKVMNYSARGGALQRYLPVSEFAFRPGVTRIR
jgi:hypothetical protein